MILVHVGIRPEYKTVFQSVRFRNYHLEELPNGDTKVWTEKMMRSGCNQELSDVVRKYRLIYCEHCGEFFSKNQFKEKK